MKKFLYPVFGVLFLFSCTKSSLDINSPETKVASKSVEITNKYIRYTILEGQHYSDSNFFKIVTVKQMNFVAKFDSSAVYQSALPENQYDINKLYGFSEGYDHQYNSARMGWAWNDGALRLYAYAYNNGVRVSKEISKVDVGSEISCSIAISAYSYVFKVNDVSTSLPRASATDSASGYQLYPYFGGDEVAPHNVYISIKIL